MFEIPDPKVSWNACAWMAAATLFLFAPLWLYVFGVFPALVVPGLLMGAGLATLHRLNWWRQLFVACVGGASELGLVFLIGLDRSHPVRLLLYSASASLLIATLLLVLGRRRISFVRLAVPALIGAVSSLSLLVVPDHANYFSGTMYLGLCGAGWLWSQYFLHQRYVIPVRP